MRGTRLPLKGTKRERDFVLLVLLSKVAGGTRRDDEPIFGVVRVLAWWRDHVSRSVFSHSRD
jgi:hypothetical protein